MQRYELNDLLQKFLQHQNLADFSLVFEPFTRRGSRRAKRGTSTIQANDPFASTVLPKTRNVQELFAKLNALAPETGEWFEKKEHRPRLYDDVGVLIKDDELLGDLRTRSVTRLQEGEQRSRKILLKAIQSCDRLLDAADVNRIIKDILAERRAR